MKNQRKNHGHRRKNNCQQSASHTLIKKGSSKRSNLLEMRSDAESLFQEAVMLLEDSQNPDDYIMAEELLKEAVTHGHVGAQIQLGRILRSEGRHDKNGDTAKALKLFRLAAEKGNVEAMIELGLTLMRGNGSEHDKAEGKQWLEKSAELGLPSAKSILALYYLEESYGYKKDVGKALKLLKEAYQKADVKAALALGMMHLTGVEAHMDVKLGVKYLKFAAKNGELSACFYLGLLYAQGRGVKKDKTKSARFLLMAARGGHVDAQRTIGMF
jgi:TPR repeat protein